MSLFFLGAGTSDVCGSEQAPVEPWCGCLQRLPVGQPVGGWRRAWCQRSEQDVGFSITTENQKPRPLGFPFVSMKPKVLLKT